MTLDFDGERFLFIGSYDQRTVPKEAGFRWDPKAKRWYTIDPDRAQRLCAAQGAQLSATAACISQLARIRHEHEQTLEASRATDATLDVVLPAGLEYLPYQKAGIAFGLARRDVLIGDEMGLGKTVEALGIVNQDASIERVLVICQAALKINWKREAERWLARPFSIHVASNREWPGTPEGERDIVIVNYDDLHTHRELNRSLDCDLH